MIRIKGREKDDEDTRLHGDEVEWLVNTKFIACVCIKPSELNIYMQGDGGWYIAVTDPPSVDRVLELENTQ